jgi:SpoVK/Ycf46/Vps4 family AAA+-type ATPase
MARGELMKRLLASYGQDDEFRAVAEQIILEEEQKNNRVLARSLRRTLENAPAKPKPMLGLAPLLPFPDGASDFVERVEPSHTQNDIALSLQNIHVFRELMKEFRRGDDIRQKGLPLRSKLLFCGPPGCGKTLGAEVFAYELGLPMFVVKLDRLISSYLGETASNVRKIFEFARKQPCVLFFDEFDALARSRDDTTEHNELRRVVNWKRSRRTAAFRSRVLWRNSQPFHELDEQIGGIEPLLFRAITSTRTRRRTCNTSCVFRRLARSPLLRSPIHRVRLPERSRPVTIQRGLK